MTVQAVTPMVPKPAPGSYGMAAIRHPELEHGWGAAADERKARAALYPRSRMIEVGPLPSEQPRAVAAAGAMSHRGEVDACDKS